jgi:hypothetical protein
MLIESLGRSAKLRGRRNRARHALRYIVLDFKGNRDITSPTERRRAWEWFTREVRPAGTEATNVVSVGTALHREAVVGPIQVSSPARALSE